MPPSSLRVVYAFAREMHPKTSEVFIQYGTAGFRTKANLLEHVVYRMGLLAVIRSRVKNGRTIGIMITASHNLEPDNGVKLIDPDGEMLEQSWEQIATKLANVSDNDLESTTEQIIKEVNADMALKASVFIGMDTRNHGIAPLHQLLLTLRFYALGTMLVAVADYTGVSKSSAARIVLDVSKAIAKLYPNYVYVLNNTEEDFYNIAGFPRVLGAVDGTHILIQSPNSNIGEEFRNRKSVFSMNVQGVCNAQLIFMNMVARWPGSTHDATIFNNSELRGMCENGAYGNRWLLGDSAYPCRPYLLTPLLNTQTPSEERYNNSHIKTRNTIERYTSPRLAAAAVHGVIALKGTAKEFGIVTTPMLHYCVKCRNDNSYGTPTEEGYYDKIVGSFKKIREKLPVFGEYNTTLYIDGANGVGGKKLNIIKKTLDGELDLNIYNLGGNGGKLNLNCGADFVKVSQKPPVGVEHIPFQRVASLDGDADRIVYYYLDDKQAMHLLDGDRIATLLASYITELIKNCEAKDLKLGLVQTAYANGASTQYITEELQVPVTCVKTGVKHLHHAAQAYDIGVYFEANGHGTVLYSQRTKDVVTKIAQEGEPEQRKAAQLLLNFIDMTNETVGDAISDLFLVETVLCAKGYNVRQWMDAYNDLPCRQLKVVVKDRNTISTTDAERQCTSPEGLQLKIDELKNAYKHGRAFVRASGTEDIVRVYAEADTRQNADKLATEVAQAVYDLAGGVGDRPEIVA